MRESSIGALLCLTATNGVNRRAAIDGGAAAGLKAAAERTGKESELARVALQKLFDGQAVPANAQLEPSSAASAEAAIIAETTASASAAASAALPRTEVPPPTMCGASVEMAADHASPVIEVTLEELSTPEPVPEVLVVVTDVLEGAERARDGAVARVEATNEREGSLSLVSAISRQPEVSDCLSGTDVQGSKLDDASQGAGDP